MASCLLALLLYAPVSTAQIPEFGSLRGFVTDATSGESLIGANVILEGTGRGRSTNASGFFALTQIETGTYTVICSYIGYKAFRQEMVIGAGVTQRLDIALEPEATLVDEVVVSAERLADEEARDLGIGQITVETIKELPTVFEPDVFRTLQLLPGVAQASDYSSGLYIRGGDPGQTLILLDRTKIYNPSHVFGFFSTFNPDAIKDVRLYKGGFPAFYGGSLGSVLDIKNKDGNRFDNQGGLSIGLLASRAIAEGPYSRGSWMIAARRSTLEPLLYALRSIDGIPDQFYFYDLNGKINIDATPEDRLSLSFYVGADNLRLEFLEDAQLRIAYGNSTLTGNWTHLFSSHLLVNLTLTTSRYNSKPRAIVGGTEFQQTNSIYETSVRADLEYFSSGQHNVEGGIWAGMFLAPFVVHFDGEETFKARNRVEHASAYIQDTYEPSADWKLRGGIRATYFANGRYLTLAPRLSLERRMAANLRLQASVGRYYQFQTLVTNESFSGFDFWLTSSKGIKPAYGDQYIVGAKTNLGYGLTLDTEVYYRTMRRLFEPDPFLADPAGLDYADIFTVGKGSARGVEVQLTRDRGQLFGFLAYTLGYTDRYFPGINLDATGQPRSYPPKNDRLHDFNGVVRWRLGRSWELSAVFSFATGQAFTDPVARYQLQNTGLITGSPTTDVLLSSGLNQSRLPAYHRLDVGGARKGRFFKFADYELQLQVINAYARRNVWFILHQFENDGSVDRLTVPQIPIPLPNLSFALTF